VFKDPEIYRTILNSLQIGVSVIDPQRKIIFWSDGAEQLTGYSRIDVLGRSCSESVFHHCGQTQCQLCGEHCPIAQALREMRAVEALTFIHHKSGYRSQMHVCAIPLRDEHGAVIGVIQTFEGESAANGPDPNERSLKEHGCLDEVTSLLNQATTQSHLRETIGTFHELHIPFGILLAQVCGLDQFRARYGQGASRSMLQVLARTLRSTVWPSDIVGCWAGDAFLVILMGCTEYALSSVSNRIQQMMSSASIHWWGEELSVQVTLGRATAQAGDTLDSIVKRAREGQKQLAAPAGGGLTEAAGAGK